MIDYYGLEDYRVDYSNIPQNGAPDLKRVIAHAKNRFEQRFVEEWNGNYAQARATFAALANNGLSERDIFGLVDWFYGLIADRCVHSFNLLRRLPDAYITFVEINKSRRRAGEDWYGYCSRIKNKINERNQSYESLDELISKIVINN